MNVGTNPVSPEMSQELNAILGNMERSPSQVARGETVTESGTMATDKYSNISASDMRGDPVTVDVGPLSFRVKPLCRRDIRRFQTILWDWPQVLRFAATVPNPKTYPIDYEATTDLTNTYLQSVHKITEQDREKKCRDANIPFVALKAPALMTADQVATSVDDLVWRMSEEEDKTIRDTVRLFTDPLQVLTDEELQEMLDPLEVPEYAFLLRLLVRACGRFRGCLSDRMFRGDDGQET